MGGSAIIRKAADRRQGAHRAAEVKGKGRRVQGTQLSHLVGSIEDHPGCLNEREAKDGIDHYVGPTCHKEGRRMPFARKVRHVKLECNREVGGDGCTTLLDNTAQNNRVMVRRAEDGGNGVGECLCNGRVVMEVASVKGGGSINNAANGGAL